jgi:hypothetical protein
MKERIRDNLKMVEDHLDSFNKHALRWIDPEELRKWISVWRWYVSHGYMTWLDAHLNGQTTPLARDIGLCISPVVASSIMTEHAARRIMNRLPLIVHYVSPEAALEDQQEHRKREDKKHKDRARAAKARADRKDERKVRTEQFIEKNKGRLTKEWQKKKDRERKDLRERREKESEIVRKRAIQMIQEAKQEMKERRGRGD